MASAVSNTVKARADELVKSVQQTDWKAELMAFSKEAAEETKTLSNKTVELVEHIPEVVEHLPEKVLACSNLCTSASCTSDAAAASSYQGMERHACSLIRVARVLCMAHANSSCNACVKPQYGTWACISISHMIWVWRAGRASGLSDSSVGHKS